MNADTRPFDVGLQLERTALAWRRTVLALAVAAMASVRVLFEVIGYAAIAVGVVGLAVALLLRLLSGRRYRQAHHWLTNPRPGHPPLPGAAALALCAALVACAGLGALAYVVVAALS